MIFRSYYISCTSRDLDFLKVNNFWDISNTKERMRKSEKVNNNGGTEMKEFIEYIAKELVDKPDEVKVTEIVGERTNICELHVGEGDLGKVIGKHGHTARSIRTLLAAASAKKGKRTILEILE